jgi:hypothetical protein
MFFPASTIQREMWASEFENFGVVTGSVSGLVVVDIDNDAAFLECEARGLTTTVTIKTPRGYHLYYQHPGIAISNSAGKLADGVDIRGDGGFCVGPGSYYRPNTAERAQGKLAGEYWPVPTMGPGEVPLAPLPAWIIDHLKSHEPKEPQDRPTAPVGVETVEAPAMPSAYALAAVRGELEHLRGTRSGSRNQNLFIASARLGEFVAAGSLTQTDAEHELTEAANVIGLPSDESNATIKSGLSHGLQKPRVAPTPKPAMSAAMARKLLKSSKGK